jgi:predicted RNA-binding protein associated with RNAse of E/G family
MENISNDELFARFREAQAAADAVRHQIRARNIGWQNLASYGMKAEAVLAYRDRHKVMLREAHDAVNSFLLQLNS